ncbi:MMPL family transporter [Acetobacter indonesiensis]|uniref:MMPL family transporter n=1 Tax=Acetobacter indonesiensis TaxID=104101 RepID=UPI0020A515EB|nr:MMPL family transporter [Acetobacter indonesiensis]MCP1231549.1 MMPL family transporter [Acetobacter indonesiensis]
MTRPARPHFLAVALALSALLAAVVMWAIPLRLDMAGFLPKGHNDGTRFLLREVQEGVAGTVVMLGIEGAPEPELARLSLGLQKALSGDPQFVSVMNGVFSVQQTQGLHNAMMAHRYQLAPDASTRDFRPQALEQAFDTVLDGLGSSAGAVFSDMLLRDPTKAFLNAVQALEPDVQVRMQHGVWFASDQPRALLLLRTTAPGMDLVRQKAVQQTLQSAFAGLHPGPARLLMSGPSIFAVRSASGMRADMDLMALCSILMVAGVLYWRFRSLWVLAAIGVPFFLSLSVAMVVVRLVFGYVHGIALGFGMTMLGVALDYPVLLIGHRDRGEGPEATLHRIGHSLRLGVTTAILGLTGMVFCGLPGLAQLGTFAAVGLMVAACVTLYLMPRLVVAADLAPSVSGPSRKLARAETVRCYRLLCLVPVLISVFWLWQHPLTLDTRLAALSPIPEQAHLLDDALRHELGVPDASLMLAVSGPSAQAVLEREEALAGVWARLQQQGALSGVQDAARLLPSMKTQRHRVASLPSVADLQNAVAEARQNLPYKPDAFSAFVHDVASARTLTPLSVQDMAGTPLEAALSPLLFERQGQWFGLVFPERVQDRAAIEHALADQPDVLVVDMKREIDGLSAHYTARTLRWMLVGCALAVGVLVYGLRSVSRLVRVMASVGAALISLLAVLAGLGHPLTLIHLISLQFVLGVSLDYALFFARPQLDDAERARTMRTLLTCNAMTVLTFGLLATCNTPLLQEIGKTVALGVLFAMAYGFLLAGQRPKMG